MNPDPSIVINLKAKSGATDRLLFLAFSPGNEKLYFPTKVQYSKGEENQQR